MKILNIALKYFLPIIVGIFLFIWIISVADKCSTSNYERKINTVSLKMLLRNQHNRDVQAGLKENRSIYLAWEADKKHDMKNRQPIIQTDESELKKIVEAYEADTINRTKKADILNTQYKAVVSDYKYQLNDCSIALNKCDTANCIAQEMLFQNELTMQNDSIDFLELQKQIKQPITFWHKVGDFTTSVVAVVSTALLIATSLKK
jgi:hypothetical protein